jgi:hypothetical protein
MATEVKKAKKPAKRADRIPEPLSRMQRVLVYTLRTTARGALGLRKNFEWRERRTP